MRPTVARLLDVTAAHLGVRTAPALGGYEQATVTILGVMLLVVSEEAERAVARRVEENAALRALFARALAVVGEPGLRDRLASLAASRDDRLSVSALDASNAALRAALIDLHAHVETREGAPARELEEAIWAELRVSTERRRLAIAPF